MNFPSDLETLCLLNWSKVDDYLMAPYPNGAGEMRVIRDTLGFYEYTANGEAKLVNLKTLRS
jgi:hypothetical protein